MALDEILLLEDEEADFSIDQTYLGYPTATPGQPQLGSETNFLDFAQGGTADTEMSHLLPAQRIIAQQTEPTFSPSAMALLGCQPEACTPLLGPAPITQNSGFSDQLPPKFSLGAFETSSECLQTGNSLVKLNDPIASQKNDPSLDEFGATFNAQQALNLISESKYSGIVGRGENTTSKYSQSQPFSALDQGDFGSSTLSDNNTKSVWDLQSCPSPSLGNLSEAFIAPNNGSSNFPIPCPDFQTHDDIGRCPHLAVGDRDTRASNHLKDNDSIPQLMCTDLGMADVFAPPATIHPTAGAGDLAQLCSTKSSSLCIAGGFAGQSKGHDFNCPSDWSLIGESAPECFGALQDINSSETPEHLHMACCPNYPQFYRDDSWSGENFLPASNQVSPQNLPSPNLQDPKNYQNTSTQAKMQQTQQISRSIGNQIQRSLKRVIQKVTNEQLVEVEQSKKKARGRNGPLSKQQASQTKEIRLEKKICIICRFKRVKCDGSSPCQSCRNNFRGKFYGQPCLKAHFFDIALALFNEDNIPRTPIYKIKYERLWLTNEEDHIVTGALRSSIRYLRFGGLGVCDFDGLQKQLNQPDTYKDSSKVQALCNKLGDILLVLRWSLIWCWPWSDTLDTKPRLLIMTLYFYFGIARMSLPHHYIEDAGLDRCHAVTVGDISFDGHYPARFDLKGWEDWITDPELELLSLYAQVATRSSQTMYLMVAQNEEGSDKHARMLKSIAPAVESWSSSPYSRSEIHNTELEDMDWLISRRVLCPAVALLKEVKVALEEVE
ncbi:hypothetical protein ACLMJK_006969 [Lecanora helva]